MITRHHFRAPRPGEITFPRHGPVGAAGCPHRGPVGAAGCPHRGPVAAQRRDPFTSRRRRVKLKSPDDGPVRRCAERRVPSATSLRTSDRDTVRLAAAAEAYPRPGRSRTLLPTLPPAED